MRHLITRSQKAPIAMLWAAFPGPTLAPQGFYFFTDVGINGSMWYNNGSTLDPCGPIVLSRLTNQVASSNGTAEEAYAISAKILAGILKTGRKLQIFSNFAKSGTVETTSNQFKIGTNANGITGATTISSVIACSTTNRGWVFESSHQIMSDTTLQQATLGGSAQPAGLTTSAVPSPRTIPSVSANDLYVSITGTKGTGGIETITIMHFDVVMS